MYHPNTSKSGGDIMMKMMRSRLYRNAGMRIPHAGHDLNISLQEEIEEAAQLANAHDFIMALPKGYSTMVCSSPLSFGCLFETLKT